MRFEEYIRDMLTPSDKGGQGLSVDLARYLAVRNDHKLDDAPRTKSEQLAQFEKLTKALLSEAAA